MNTLICTSIRNKNLVQFVYDGKLRIVEPYCYGLSNKNNELLSGYQLEGGSQSGVFGWKLFDLSKVQSLKILNENFNVIRQEYNPKDKALQNIYCNIGL